MPLDLQAIETLHNQHAAEAIMTSLPAGKQAALMSKCLLASLNCSLPFQIDKVASPVSSDNGKLLACMQLDVSIVSSRWACLW